MTNRPRLARFNAADALGQVLNAKSKEENSSTDRNELVSDKEDHMKSDTKHVFEFSSVNDQDVSAREPGRCQPMSRH